MNLFAAKIAEMQETGLPVFLLKDLPKKHISSGFFTLDYFLLGGFERRKITEIVGWDSTGRTSLCLHTAEQVQKEGGIVAIVDTEDCLEMAQKRLHPDRTVFCPFHVVKDLLATGCVDLLIIDSIAAISYETGYGSKYASKNISMVVGELRNISELIKKSNTACLITNQFRQSPRGIYTYAEAQLSAYFDVRLFLTKIANRSKFIQEGFRLNLVIKKHKNYPEFENKEVELDIFPQQMQFAEVSKVIEIALQKGIIRYNGRVFIFKNNPIGKKSQIGDFMKTNWNIFEEIKKEVFELSIRLI
jgi:recombination protein RecA